MKPFKNSLKCTLVVTLLLLGETSVRAQSGDVKQRQITTVSGLIYEILKPGSGIGVQEGDEVLIQEEMGYRNGHVLFSSKNMTSPLRLLIGGNQAIAGLDEGIRGMKPGEIRKMIVPPSLSKRKQYPKFLSPDSTLVYFVELIDVIPPQRFPPLSFKGEIHQQVGFVDIDIYYERPAARGRTIFGNLVPYDQLWRTGAGAGTKIAFSDSVKIANHWLAAGTYSLFTIPSENEWTVLFNQDTSLYGTHRYDKQLNILRFKTPVAITKSFKETFTIGLQVIPDDIEVHMSWENTLVKFSIETNTYTEITKYIDRELIPKHSQNPQQYAMAANYYFFRGQELDKALTLINTAIQRQGLPWCHRLKMDILIKMNHLEEAIKAGNEALAFLDANPMNWSEARIENSKELFNDRIVLLQD